MQLEGKAGFSISEACDAARISRAGFYRHFEDHAPQQSATELRDQIQQICLNSRCYGYRRFTAALRAQGRIVNHCERLHSTLGYLTPAAYEAEVCKQNREVSA